MSAVCLCVAAFLCTGAARACCINPREKSGTYTSSGRTVQKHAARFWHRRPCFESAMFDTFSSAHLQPCSANGAVTVPLLTAPRSGSAIALSTAHMSTDGCEARLQVCETCSPFRIAIASSFVDRLSDLTVLLNSLPTSLTLDFLLDPVNEHDVRVWARQHAPGIDHGNLSGSILLLALMRPHLWQSRGDSGVAAVQHRWRCLAISSQTCASALECLARLCASIAGHIGAVTGVLARGAV